MASKFTEDLKEETQPPVPTAVIAQAQAAIAGNYENGMPALQKKVSRRPLPRNQSQFSTRSTRANLPQGEDSDTRSLYGDNPDEIDLSQAGFDTKAKVTDDGRINININQKTRKLSDLLVPALRQQLSYVAQEESQPLPPGYIPPALGGLPGQTPPPTLNVVIHVVGSRGDVQPFVALGKVLKSTYGHRVRLATHPTFKGFVEENGLEFFSIGGDPAELMAFMVKNPGLMPGMESLKSGDVGRRRKGMEEIVLGCWRSCIEAGNGLGPSPRRDSSDSLGACDAGINMDVNPEDRPFIADAIVANPPSFAHIHIAEKLGIPLHMMFTMPWSPTQQFPHPLANIQSSNADVNMTNFVSYALVEMMTWQGLGDVINRFREKALQLDPISVIWAPGMLNRLRVPYTYCWSPALIPKPKDWAQHISISGFYFLSLASSYTPEAELAAYLAAGPPPVYIGFGSIVVDDPNAMTSMIFEAVKKAGVRALVSKGWGGLGANELGKPDGVFMLGNCPHDWLFQHVSAVVHHGGAGTTAAGIALGKPTVVVPFFGDQPFWGAMVARAGAGPLPIPYKQLTADKLAAAIIEALKPETLERAKELGDKIKEEKGTETGGKSFHDLLDVDSLRCSIAPSRVAVWRLKRTKTRLSALAAYVLAHEKLIDFADLKLYRSREYETDDGPWDPISGAASALIGTVASLGMGVADFPIEIFRAVKKKETGQQDNLDKSKDISSSASSALSVSTSPTRTLSQHDLSLSQVGPTSPMSPRSQSRAEIGLSKVTSPGSYAPPMSPISSEDTARSSSEAPTSSDTPATSFTSHGERRGNSLRNALRGTLSRSRSQSRERDRASISEAQSVGKKRCDTSGSPFRRDSNHNESFDPSKLTLDNVTRAGKGVSRIVGAGMRSPMDFTLGLARGFHNAPKLYGDDTVRTPDKVTDFGSGLKAAGKEFGYGLFDGITGLVTQPMRGAEKEGAAGLMKGIGKGIGGLILKPGAAVWSLPGYAFLGIHKEVRKLYGSSVLNYIIATRTAQGFEDAQQATKEECRDIIARWQQYKTELQNEKMRILEDGGPEGQGSGHLTPRGFMQTRHLSFEERKRLHNERKQRRDEEQKKLASMPGHRHCVFCGHGRKHKHEPGTVEAADAEPSILSRSDTDLNEEFEHAIHASVAATSKGNAEEDMIIERAIRASVRELQASGGSTLTDEEALQKAIQASVSAAGRRISSDMEPATTPGLTDDEAAHQAALEKAIQASLAEYQLPVYDEDVDVDTDEDENIKTALHKSKVETSQPDSDLDLAIHKSKSETLYTDQELEEALARSKAEHEKGMTEEDIVLEYVKKQSLLEEQHKRSLEAKTKAKDAAEEDRVSAADNEALRRAIEESMKASNGSTEQSSGTGTGS